jgi:hypothetical protein
LDWIYTPITLTSLRRLLHHISAYKVRRRDDHLYGATIYLANSLGIFICDTNSSDLIDQPMTSVGKKQVWRSATFHCQCNNNTGTYHTFHVRTFCKMSSFLISDNNESTFTTICPFCHINESWKNICHPCLVCQFATIMYRNPFHVQFQQYLRVWLHSEELDGTNSKVPHRPSLHNTNLSVQDMIHKRNLTFEHSFWEIKSKASPKQRKYIFENLAILQNNF